MEGRLQVQEALEELESSDHDLAMTWQTFCSLPLHETTVWLLEL
jgi:hypothetical protein